MTPKNIKDMSRVDLIQALEKATKPSRTEILAMLTHLRIDYMRDIKSHYDPLINAIGHIPGLEESIKERDVSIQQFINFVGDKL